jgi:CIC family chloride channel protein
VLDDFKRTGVWNIPVIEDERYIGFVSRSRLLSEYRKKVVDLSED